jgi:5-methylcytosine-specific restriction endonuclease McrA
MIQGQQASYGAYDEYLVSPEWRARRLAALERAGDRCQLCNRDGHLHVHHRTYDRVGHEDPGDLTVLCDECHAWFHVPRTTRLLEEGHALAQRATDEGGMDSRRVLMHLARATRMDRAGG